MSVKFKYTVFIIMCFAALSIQAAQPKFYSINSLFGISIRNANSVCEDDNGFIWASSRTGIIRLTDDDYRIYNLDYETADVITVKLVYKNSGLVAYTNNGQVFLYNTVFDRFDLLVNLSKSLNNPYISVHNLLIDNSGTLWISSTVGLHKFEKGTLTIVDNSSMFSLQIAWLNNQQLILVNPQSIWLFDIDTQQSEIIYGNSSMPPNFASSLFFDKDQNKLWIGTISDGIFCYDFNTSTYSEFSGSVFPKQPVLAIEENTDSTLLVGVDGQGIWEIDKENEEIINVYKENPDDPTSLKGNGIYDIYRSHDNKIWICTISGGVSFFEQTSPMINQVVHQLNNYNSLVNNDVNCIIEDSRGKLWFATNNGISVWDVSSNHWETFYRNNLEHAQVFLSLCEDSKGRIWAGSYSSGLYILDGKTGKELIHYSQGIPGSPLLSDFIFSIYKDSEGDIWIGGINGYFSCYLSKEDRFRTYTTEPISNITELEHEEILLGCSYGLTLVNKITGSSERLLTGLLISDVLVIDSILWICTCGDGLVRFAYKKGSIEKFTINEGLPSNFINSIVFVNDYLWLGTENGLCRFDPANNKTVTFSSVYPLSGISYNSSSPFLMKNGQLAWGTNNGAVFFDPESVKEAQTSGRIFIQDIVISGRSIRKIPAFDLQGPIDSIQYIKLKFTQNNLSIELLPLGSPSDSKFSWKMEGFDADWTLPGDNRFLTYTNIPSGKFDLKIRLYNSSLSQVIAERSFVIKSVPPFWKTVWFFIFSFILMLGLISLYFLYYISRLKQIHTEEKVRFFTNTAHDIRTSLTLIKAPVEELKNETGLSRSGRNYLNLAIEQARRLTSVVTQLMDFQKIDIGKEKPAYSMADIVSLVSNRVMMFESFAKSKNIDLIFDSERKSYSTAVDEAKMEKVVDNLISNAVKYSLPKGQVKILLKFHDTDWILEVKDYGIGISRKAQRQLFKEFYRGDNAVNTRIVGSGIGLLLVKKYVNMHNGIISFQSQENQGSEFRIVIPYKKIADSVETAKDLNFIKVSEPSQNNPKVQLLGDKNVSTQKMKVLIVEDNQDLLEFLENTLSRDFNTYTAENGKQAWEFISKQIPDLIVSDVMMPDMDGFELCRVVKSTYETSHIPLILLTSLSEKAEQLHGLGLGADDYLTKPFDMNLLVQRIRTIIRNREIVRDRALKLTNESLGEPVFSNELNNKFVKRMIEVANANISNSEFNKEKFASEMNVSPSLLYKKIKTFTGQSPTDFIKTIRLNRAMESLQSKKYTVTEVSELCGFTSVAYFSTVFRKFYGKPPTEYIK
ncbi:MAG: response regulator [Prolixibacteraceae bacterium]|nr:response regulator [Prolixibacteraceae bacterium]MBN2773413.1 response regulator [Prolixibacteraceae bacterium]